MTAQPPTRLQIREAVMKIPARAHLGAHAGTDGRIGISTARFYIVMLAEAREQGAKAGDRPPTYVPQNAA